ncbi:hypothetical protein [Faecalibacter rhinopitheci]|uniref:Uncharacterized protein n=1 Tax=Faecalibacter rhinopitheci TaxID=2779678 RepID=A0A8J7KIS7_9FLAO|nr:hypothetical protein [Faecalibacter rhinopitheci]MBF0598326.1 hypothetical protein [Faecalibacter rhinopitheci]
MKVNFNNNYEAVLKYSKYLKGNTNISSFSKGTIITNLEYNNLVASKLEEIRKRISKESIKDNKFM